jgi:branched-chain amino acid transport system ATP-binding protein
MGLLPVTGNVEFAGTPLKRTLVEKRVAAGMSLVPERRELFSTMCVEENLQLGAFPLSDADSADRLADIYGRFPRLKERRRQQAGTLSGGERQMLAMGRALMAGPKLLMLDEPSLGLAPRIVSEVFRAIVELSGTGISILLVEQNARSALQVAHRAYVMELGEMVMAGAASELANDPRVVSSYLGL